VLISIFLVILAGGIVRTTQSGMGCPDWPHCFGLWIPPTNVSQLPPDYQKYLDKQNIDLVYNPFHAWVEYINRALTGLLGILIFIHVLWSFKNFFRTKPSICWWSFSLLLLVVLEAWIGKTVVDSNLAVIKITAHLIPALMIATVPVIILNKLNVEEKISNNSFKWIANFAIIFLLAQIIIGTQVRSEVDVVSQLYNYSQRENWIKMLDHFFNIHAAFSFVVSVFCLLLFWKGLSYNQLRRKTFIILFLVLAEMCLGFIMAYNNIPAFVQPVHLLFASMLIITLLDYRLKFE
jgi:cytochrome c oxidase assembly protein subunit 15